MRLPLPGDMIQCLVKLTRRITKIYTPVGLPSPRGGSAGDRSWSKYKIVFHALCFVGSVSFFVFCGGVWCVTNRRVVCCVLRVLPVVRRCGALWDAVYSL